MLRFLLVFFLTVSFAASAGAERVKLRVQSGFPFNLPVIGEGVKHFAELIDASGRDDVRVKVYEAEKLAPTL